MPDKWTFALGTTSRVPGAPGWHYLILDFDGKIPLLLMVPTVSLGGAVWQKTKHGWHVYTNVKMRFNPMLRLAARLGADPSWIRIARTRGYAFLADKEYLAIPWPVERMAIGRR